jgi:hypothetical protein
VPSPAESSIADRRDVANAIMPQMWHRERKRSRALVPRRSEPWPGGVRGWAPPGASSVA